jgi:hypothetical protein
MRAAYVGGATLESIGKEWGISGERVRQIVRPILTDADRAGRAASVARRTEQRHSEIIAYLNDHPNAPLSEVAERFGVDRRTVSRLYDGPPRPRKARSSPVKWSEEAMLESLRTVIGDRSPSAITYTSTEHDGPSLALIIRHFDTWQNAVTAAGLTANSTPRREYERLTDDWDSVFAEAVKEFLAVEVNGGHTWRQFVEWAKDRTPSPHTMRAMASITYGQAQRLALTD